MRPPEAAVLLVALLVVASLVVAVADEPESSVGNGAETAVGAVHTTVAAMLAARSFRNEGIMGAIRAPGRTTSGEEGANVG
ncbi:hypothetical protein GCM10027063_11920 [Promicromonospora xylanilytica]